MTTPWVQASIPVQRAHMMRSVTWKLIENQPFEEKPLHIMSYSARIIKNSNQRIRTDLFRRGSKNCAVYRNRRRWRLLAVVGVSGIVRDPSAGDSRTLFDDDK